MSKIQVILFRVMNDLSSLVFLYAKVRETQMFCELFTVHIHSAGKLKLNDRLFCQKWKPRNMTAACISQFNGRWGSWFQVFRHQKAGDHSWSESNIVKQAWRPPVKYGNLHPIISSPTSIYHANCAVRVLELNANVISESWLLEMFHD